MKTEDATHDILKYNLSRYLPIRIVLDETDGIKGLVEHSFTMDHDSTRVRIWWSGKAFSMLGEHDLSAEDDAAFNCKSGDKIYDPFDPACPVEIDWDGWIKATDKFGKRNAKFKVKNAVQDTPQE